MRVKDYSPAIRETQKLLADENPGNLELKKLIDQIISACNKALVYNEKICPPPSYRFMSERSLKPILRSAEKLVEYLRDNPARAARQVSHALFDVGVKFEQKESHDAADNGKVMQQLLLALHHHIKSRSSLFNLTAEERRIGNLVYPLPDESWDRFNVLTQLPKTPPSPQTMLAFELVCRFRYWSLGKLLEFKTETDCAPMPKGGLPRYDLVDCWVREAFEERLEETFASVTRVPKLPLNTSLTRWPIALLDASRPPS